VCFKVTVTVRLTLNLTEYCNVKAFGAFEVRVDLVRVCDYLSLRMYETT
jgi:hypothetical protein